MLEKQSRAMMMVMREPWMESEMKHQIKTGKGQCVSLVAKIEQMQADKLLNRASNQS